MSMKLLTILGLSISLILWYYGAFISVKGNIQQVGGVDFVYYNRIGRYEQSQDDWIALVQQMQETFTNSVPTGIYYDNPNSIQDPNQSRLSIGFIVQSNESSRIQSFIEKYGQFKHVYLPNVDAAHIEFPYKSALSFSIIKFKVYSALMEFIQQLQVTPTCIIEIYNFGENLKYQNVQFYAPYGNGSDQYLLF